MMSLLVDLVVVFFMVCAGAALFVGLLQLTASRLLARQSVGLRARLQFVALVFPLVAGTLAVTASLAPSILHVAGLAEDHCLALAHEHTHLCFIHRPAGGSFVLTLFAVAMAVWVMRRAILVGMHWLRDQAAFASVLATSSVQELASGEHLFDSEIPICATIGVLRPTVYISSAAATALGPKCTLAARAHERGHIARHETRARLLISFAEIFHLPYVGRALAHSWHEDSELLCDQYAARDQRSGTIVAEALVRFQRALLVAAAMPIAAGAGLCAADSAIDQRVSALLDSEPLATEGAREPVVAFVLGFVILLLGFALQMRHIHHVLESIVGSAASLFT